MSKKVMAVMVLVLVLGTVAVSMAWAAQTLIGGEIKYWSTRGIIVDLRRLPDNSVDMVVIVNDKVTMFKSRGGNNMDMTPLKEYDVAAIKKLGGGAGKAQTLYMETPHGKNSKTHVRGVTLRKNDEDKHEYLVHLYIPANSAYVASMVIDVETWQATGAQVKLPEDPNVPFWSKEQQEGGSNNWEAVDAVKKGAPVPKAENGEGEGRGEGGLGGGRQGGRPPVGMERDEEEE